MRFGLIFIILDKTNDPIYIYNNLLVSIYTISFYSFLYSYIYTPWRGFPSRACGIFFSNNVSYIVPFIVRGTRRDVFVCANTMNPVVHTVSAETLVAVEKHFRAKGYSSPWLCGCSLPCLAWLWGCLWCKIVGSPTTGASPALQEGDLPQEARSPLLPTPTSESSGMEGRMKAAAVVDMGGEE